MIDERERELALAYLQAVANCFGVTPRPIGYLALSNIRLLGLRLADPDLSEFERTEQMHAFVFLQCAPLKLVQTALRAYSRIAKNDPLEQAFENFMDEFVTPWFADVDLDKMEAALAQLEDLPELDAAMVDPGKPPEVPGRSNRPDQTDPN